MNHHHRLVTAITACALTGCATTVTTGTPTAPVTEQIRHVLERVAEGYLTLDVDQIATFTCTKYRDLAIADLPADGINEALVPPMEVMPVDVLARVERQQLADQLGAEYVGAARRSLLDLADAFIARDPAAYEVAMNDVMRQTLVVSVDDLDNVFVLDDFAGVDTRVSFGTGGVTSFEIAQGRFELRYEDGRCKDCTPPVPSTGST